MSSVVLKILVIDPMCMTVSGVIVTPLLMLVRPAAAVRISPFANTAALAPTTRWRASASSRSA